MQGEKIIGWRNRPASAPAASTGSVFLADPVFNGRNTGIAARTAAFKAQNQPVILPGSIHCETKTQAQDKRRKLLKAAI